MSLVNMDTAREEINAWLDEKKVRESKREKFKEHIETLALAVSDGLLTRKEETNELVQKLQFPVGTLNELVFKPRLNNEMLRPFLKNIAHDDASARLNAYVSALTTQTTGLISKIDTEDIDISQTIAVFFL